MEPGGVLWRHRSVTRIRWGVAALALAATAFGVGSIGTDEDPTTVRTERMRDAAADSSGPAASPEHGAGAEQVRAVVARTTADGTLLRVIERSWEEGAPQGGGWTPPPSCVSVASLEIGLVTDDFVTAGWADVFGAAPDGAALWGSGTVGAGQLGLVSYAAVRTDDDGMVVQLVHAGDVVDEVAADGGWAIVAAQVPGELTEVVYGDARRSLGETDTPYQAAECQPPPPALPNDVRAASADELAAMQAALDGVFSRDPNGDPTDPRPRLTDASRLTDEWLADMRAAVASYTETGVEVEIAEAGVRDDGTGAAVYRLVGPPVGWNVAELAIVDGAWKVATRSWCDIVGMVFSCP